MSILIDQNYYKRYQSSRITHNKTLKMESENTLHCTVKIFSIPDVWTMICSIIKINHLWMCWTYLDPKASVFNELLSMTSQLSIWALSNYILRLTKRVTQSLRIRLNIQTPFPWLSSQEHGTWAWQFINIILTMLQYLFQLFADQILESSILFQ